MMHNPLAKLTVPLIQAMLNEPRHFVRQSYPRAKEENENRIPLLFTYYDKDKDMERHRAHYHFAQLKKDHAAFLYDSDNAAHRERLLKAAAQPLPYACYVNLLPKEWSPPLYLRNQIDAYMLHHLKYHTKEKAQSTSIHLKDRFGKLFLVLRWKGNRAEVPLEEIENFRVCVTT